MDATDSLPYYDTDIDRIAGALACDGPHALKLTLFSPVTGLREKLEAEIESELAAVPLEEFDISSRLPSELPELFTSSDFLRSELARVSSGQKPAPGTGLDTVRYSLPAPPASAPLDAWKKAIDNAGSQLEHQQLRLSNLELMQKYGGNAWRVANFLVEKEIERLEKQTEDVKLRTEELNRERKARQASLLCRYEDVVASS
jgi:pre-mRNA-splicing factor SPF27